MSDALISAIGVAAWFNPLRFDEPKPADPEPDPVEDENEDPEDPDPEADPDEDPAGDDKPDEGLGEAGKRALERMKATTAAAKKQAAADKKAAVAARKELAELAKKVQGFEDGQKSDLEKAQAQAARSAEQAAKAVARAVQSEIKASAGQFADPSDATDVLMRDPSKYVDASGEIDTDAIEADLADLLEHKPHWAKPVPVVEQEDPDGEPKKPGKPRPKPDPGQGSRGTPAPVDFRTASQEELAAELAKYRYRQRSL